MGRLIYFPPEPLAAEIARGVKIYSEHKGIDRTLMEDRVILGLWFDGRIKRDVEYAVWVSPGMASRWLGYLQAKEKWPPEELKKRWDAVCEHLNGRITFIVQLTAMPTLGGLDMEPVRPAEEDEVAKVRFLFTSGPGLPEAHTKVSPPWDPDRVVARYSPNSKPIEGEPLALNPSVKLLAQWQVRDRDVIGAFNWPQAAPFGAPFRSEFDKPMEDPAFPLGDYYAAWYWVSLDPGSLTLHPEGFDLRVFSSRKERIAHFQLLPRSSTGQATCHNRPNQNAN